MKVCTKRTFHAHPNLLAQTHAHVQPGLHPLAAAEATPAPYPDPLARPHPALDSATRAGAGKGAGIRRRPRGPLPPAPHILCSHQPWLRKLFLRVTAKGRPGSRGSYFRAIRAGGRRGRGVEVEAAHKARCLLLFHPTEGSICGSEQTLGIRTGRGQEKEKKSHIHYHAQVFPGTTAWGSMTDSGICHLPAPTSSGCSRASAAPTALTGALPPRSSRGPLGQKVSRAGGSDRPAATGRRGEPKGALPPRARSPLCCGE